MVTQRRLWPIGLVAALVVIAGPVVAAQEPALSKDQMREFLLTAEVVAAAPIGRGVTHPWRLTLSNGTLTHDAAFQAVDQRAAARQVGRRLERNFVDAYRYNIAAYRLAELLGLDDMMPVTVERPWDGKTGAISWWIDASLNEETRLKERRWPADMRAWSEQMSRMLLFAELVHDTDRNQGNILYTADWKLWMIDFSRAFRLREDLQRPADLTTCDRRLFERLPQLTKESIRRHTRPYLTDDEIDALLTRRDRLVKHFRTLIAEKSEERVLY